MKDRNRNNFFFYGTGSIERRLIEFEDVDKQICSMELDLALKVHRRTTLF